MRLPNRPEVSPEAPFPTNLAISEYQQMFKEAMSDHQTRNFWNFCSAHERERVKMPYEDAPRSSQ